MSVVTEYDLDLEKRRQCGHILLYCNYTGAYVCYLSFRLCAQIFLHLFT